MKKITIVLALLVVLSAGAFANDVSLIINGKTPALDVPPMIENGRTLVPLRAIFEALGQEVEWIATSQSIVSSYEGKEIKLTVGKNQAMNKGVATTLDVPPMIKNGRTLVPLRFIAESLNKDVEWNATTRTVTVNDKKLSIEKEVEKILADPNRIKTTDNKGLVSYSKNPNPTTLKEIKENLENLPKVDSGKATPISDVVYDYEGVVSHLKGEEYITSKNIVIDEKSKLTKVFENEHLIKFTSDVFNNNKDNYVSNMGILIKDGVAIGGFLGNGEQTISVSSVLVKQADYLGFMANMGYIFIENTLK